MYYNGYEIGDTVEPFSLTQEEYHVLYACNWLVDNKATLRETARNCEYSLTTLWRRIHYECRHLSPELYRCVCHQMKRNLEKRRR